MQRQQRADNVDEAGPAGGTRQVGGTTFYSRNGVWVQAELLDAKSSPAKSVRVQSMGKGYFELASQSDDLSEILAVGERVRFIWNGVTVEIGPEGEDELSAETRKLLGLN